LVVGLLLIAILPRYWVSPWATPVSIIAAIALLATSITIGRAIDLRDAIKKQL
jgi:hypothetical protein